MFAELIRLRYRCNSWLDYLKTMLSLIDTSTIYFTGPGIIDSLARTFSPSSFQEHYIVAHINYMGCEIMNFAFVIKVSEIQYPIHPYSGANLTNGFAQGLAVESSGAFSPADGVDWGYNFNAGRYQDSITFARDDSTLIVLYSVPGVTSGYIVAYDPCGAVWATNFQCNGVGGYVENLQYDRANHLLYAAGAVDGPIQIINSDGLTAPTTSTNTPSPITLNSAYSEKGFISKLDGLTGQVEWVFLGGDVTSEVNRFHGLSLQDSTLGAIGEFVGNFSASYNTLTPLISNGASEDVVYLFIDTLGLPLECNYFGTDDDDHGDAIDITYIDYGGDGYISDLEFYLTGDVDAGTTGNAVFSTFTLSPPPLISGAGIDLFMARGTYQPATGDIVERELITVYGFGDDHGMDIMATDPMLNGNGPNDIMVCGKFEDTLRFSDPIWINTSNTPINYDGFVISTALDFKHNWATAEGTIVNTGESVDAMSMYDGNVFATGKSQGQPTTTLLTRFTFMATGLTRVFTSQFTPGGVLVANEEAKANAIGVNEGTDICIIDTTLLNTGYIGTAVNTGIAFNNSVLSTTGGNNEVFIARTEPVANAYYKDLRSPSRVEDKTGFAVQLFPNPNDGSFTLIFSDAFSGEVSIVNGFGQMVMRKGVNKQSQVRVTSSLASGIYFVRVIGFGINKMMPMVITE
jgi:hypothetical protein